MQSTNRVQRKSNFKEGYTMRFKAILVPVVLAALLLMSGSGTALTQEPVVKITHPTVPEGQERVEIAGEVQFIAKAESGFVELNERVLAVALFEYAKEEPDKKEEELKWTEIGKDERSEDGFSVKWVTWDETKGEAKVEDGDYLVRVKIIDILGRTGTDRIKVTVANKKHGAAPGVVVIITPIPGVHLADLACLGLSWDPVHVIIGQPVTFNAIVANVGLSDALPTDAMLTAATATPPTVTQVVPPLARGSPPTNVSFGPVTFGGSGGVVSVTVAPGPNLDPNPLNNYCRAYVRVAIPVLDYVPTAIQAQNIQAQKADVVVHLEERFRSGEKVDGLPVRLNFTKFESGLAFIGLPITENAQGGMWGTATFSGVLDCSGPNTTGYLVSATVDPDNLKPEIDDGNNGPLIWWFTCPLTTEYLLVVDSNCRKAGVIKVDAASTGSLPETFRYSAATDVALTAEQTVADCKDFQRWEFFKSDGSPHKTSSNQETKWTTDDWNNVGTFIRAVAIYEKPFGTFGVAPVTLAVRAMSETTGELVGVPILLVGGVVSGTFHTPFTQTFPQGMAIRVQAPASWMGESFSHWSHLETGRTFTTNPLSDFALVSSPVTLIAVYKLAPTPPPPPPPVVLNVNAIAEETGVELHGVPIMLTAMGMTQTLPTPFQRTFLQGTMIRIQAPVEWTGLRFKHWRDHLGRTHLSNPLTATLVSPVITLTAVYARAMETPLTVESNCGNAQITVTPPGRTVPGQPPSTFGYSLGARVQLLASPTLSSCGMLPAVHRFKEWQINGVPYRVNPITITITGPTRAVAVYEPGVVNQPPVAVLSCPPSAEVGKPFTCDGSRSYDPDGTVAQWWWRPICPEGAPISFVPGPSINSFTCTRAGDATVELYVVDDRGARSATVRASVRITGGEGDFSLAVAPPSQSTRPGGTAAYTVTVRFTNWNKAVRLSASVVSPVPVGVSCSAAPSVVPAPPGGNGTGSARLTCAVSKEAKPGTYTITVVGESDGRRRSATATLIVTK